MAIIESSRNKLNQERRFAAALQGVDLDENNEKEDISSLKDYQAEFGVGMGLGYEIQGG